MSELAPHIAEWCERHGIRLLPSDAKAAFDDAASTSLSVKKEARERDMEKFVSDCIREMHTRNARQMIEQKAEQLRSWGLFSQNTRNDEIARTITNRLVSTLGLTHRQARQKYPSIFTK